MGLMKVGKSEQIRLILTAVILLGLAVAAVSLRLYRLAEVPPGLHWDEGFYGIKSLQVLQGKHAVFFPGGNGREGLIVYTIAPFVPFLGRIMLSIRLSAALASVGTVFAVFWLGWVLFGRDSETRQATPWRGLLISGIGASLMAVSLGQTIIGRTAFRANFLPLLLALSLALLWSGWGQRSRWRIILAGGCTGLLPYTYIAARFVPLLLLLFGASFLLSAPLPSRGAFNHLRSISRRLSEGVRASLPKILPFLGVAGAVAAPLLIYFALHPEHFISRSGQLWIFHPSHSQGDPLGAFLRNVWEHLLAFGVRGDPWWPYNFDSRPLLNPFEAFFFWMGIGMAVWHWRRPEYRLLVLWWAVMLLPAVLALENPPNTIRMMGMLPAAYLLVGVGMWEAFRFLRERYRAQQWRAFNFFRKMIPAIAVGTVASGMVLAQGLITYQTYFHQWAATPAVIRIYQTELIHLSRMMNAEPPNSGIVYLIPGGYRQLFLPEEFREYSFDFLYQGTAPAHLFHTAMPNLAQTIESALAVQENLSTVKVVDWNDDIDWSGDEAERIAALLGKYGRYVSSDAYVDFQIHNYTDILLDRPWTFYEHLEPLTVDYDGGIALQGLALGQGAEQLSFRQLLDLEQDRSLWVGLQWQTIPELDIDYSISLRLYDAEAEMVYQKDAVLWKANHTTTGQGGPSEPFDTVVQLDFPTDLLSGDYELRLVVYDAETLKPTVQLNVWEPDVLLARLRLP